MRTRTSERSGSGKPPDSTSRSRSSTTRTATSPTPSRCFSTQTDARWADDTLTVVIPEFVVDRSWEQLLHNQSALALKIRLLYRPNTVVTSVPWRVDWDSTEDEDVERPR